MRSLSTLARTTAITSLAAVGLSAAGTATAQAAPSCPRDPQVRLTTTGACAYGSVSHGLTNLRYSMTLLDTRNDGICVRLDLKLSGRSGLIPWSETHKLGYACGYGVSTRLSGNVAITTSTTTQMRVCTIGAYCSDWKYV